MTGQLDMARPDEAASAIDGWPVLPVIEGWTLLDEPLPEWLVDGILPKAGLALIFGESGSGKSFLVLDMAFHLALARPWFGYTTERTGLLYIAAEAGGGLAARFKAAVKRLELQRETYLSLHFIRQPVDLLDEGALAAVVQAWAACGGLARVIIIDTLSRCMAGGDENSSQDMSAAIGVIDAIRQATDATVVVVHHSPLGDKNRPRGHSSLFAAADTAIKVENINGSRSATVTYQRDGEDGQTFSFGLERVQIGTDKHCRPVTSCAVVPADSSLAEKGKPLTRAERTAMEAIISVTDTIQSMKTDGAGNEDLGNADPQSRTSAKCPVADWRAEFYRRQVDTADIKPDTRLRRFKRACESLQSRGKVGIYDGQAWIIWDNRT